MVDVAGVGIYFLNMFITWVKTIFVVPFQNVDMLWLMVPLWAAWFFAEFFQEKHGTSMGNAITNAVVVIWGSIDCTRQTFRLLGEGVLKWNLDLYLRLLLIIIILGYGVLIVILGLKGKKVIKYIGRVREVTYVFAMFVPVFYNAVPMTLVHIVAAILFMPIFYFAIELIDRYTPNPTAVVQDMEESGGEKTSGLGESTSKSSGFGDLGGGLDDLGGSKSGKKSGGDDFGGDLGGGLGDLKF
ncbi:TPA: hypothetical protein HA265_00950 [Candidatus Woesearchaeota archaeon]|nr:hypothetical protein [Candidatus Woesearchaeota archaeon]